MTIGETRPAEYDSNLMNVIAVFTGLEVKRFIDENPDATTWDVLCGPLVPRHEGDLATPEGQMLYNLYAYITESMGELSPEQEKWLAIGMAAHAAASQDLRESEG